MKGDTPLHFAALGDRTELARLLIEQGADVNARNRNRETALHLAAIYGYDVAQLLIGKGADIKLRNRDGDTPLTVAEHFASGRIVGMLRDAANNQQPGHADRIRQKEGGEPRGDQPLR
jgi:ankyrin repeat protein